MRCAMSGCGRGTVVPNALVPAFFFFFFFHHHPRRHRKTDRTGKMALLGAAVGGALMLVVAHLSRRHEWDASQALLLLMCPGVKAIKAVR